MSGIIDTNTENRNIDFLRLLREEIKSCVREVVESNKSCEAELSGSTLTLTVPQLCEQMNISRPYAYELINTEGFPSFRVGTKYLINRRGLQEWIDKKSLGDDCL